MQAGLSLAIDLLSALVTCGTRKTGSAVFQKPNVGRFIATELTSIDGTIVTGLCPFKRDLRHEQLAELANDGQLLAKLTQGCQLRT